MKILGCIVLTATLLISVMGCRRAGLPGFVTADERNAMETNECFSKGGLGIINTDLYIVTKSESNKNELLLGSDGRWAGQNASIPEVVVVFEGKIWTPQSLPQRFVKNESVVVSFEEKNIRFYDYVRMSGGYYARLERK